LSDIFQISVSALRAFQAAINVTSNNVANANTPGYDRETINLVEAFPQSNGTTSVGSGVAVAGVARSYSAAAANQLNTSQATLGSLTALQTYSTQIDNLFGTTIGGLSTSVQNYYNAWSAVANNPTSIAARQALLNQAGSVASGFNNATNELTALNTDVNNRITADVQQINSITSAIATLNQQIVVGTAQNGGQPPNELIDQRDQQVSDLSNLVSVQTTTDANGSLNVFVGNGQPLVLQGLTTQLTTVPSEFNAAQLEIGTSTSSVVVSRDITSGDLGGLLSARNEVITPTINSLGQIATALSQTVNAQQAKGLDLSGNFGAAIFAVGPPTGTPSSHNTDNVTAAVAINPANLGTLTGDSYLLSSNGTTLSLVNAQTGLNVAFTGTGTAGNPIQVNGVSITLSGTPAAGDRFLIQPTNGAATSLTTVLTDPSKIAAAGAVQTAAVNANTGSGAIGAGTVVNAADPNLLTTANIVFGNPPTTYSINGGAAQTYASGGNITFNGWQVQITGTPAAGDTFTVKSNASGSGDNRNALASINQQSQGVLNNGTVSVTSALSSAITAIGSQTQQINTAQAAQKAVNTQALNNVASITGVNMDEEAADLLKWQQAYTAAAQALAIGNTLFSTLITAVRG
jgi:flagellar hook-associated protein 1